MRIIQNVSVFILVLLVAAIMSVGTASAHVVVKPAEVITSGFQTFSVGVPNEKTIPTTSLRLEMPKGLNYVSPTQKLGWEIAIEKTGTDEDAVVTSLTWSGGAISEGFREDFTFSAQVPAEATELRWKAYQTYADGTVVSWDRSGEKEGPENTGPASVTKIVAQTESDTIINESQNSSDRASTAANTALYVAVASLVAAGVGIYLTIRKRT